MTQINEVESGRGEGGRASREENMKQCALFNFYYRMWIFTALALARLAVAVAVPIFSNCHDYTPNDDSFT